MATVTIQKYTGIRKVSYAVKYKDPATGKWKYYATFSKWKEANQSRNDLRSLIDVGQIPKPKKRKLLTFSETANILDGLWQQKLAKNELSPETVEGY